MLMKKHIILLSFFLLACFGSRGQSVDIATFTGTSGNALFGTNLYAANECIYAESEIGANSFTTAASAITHISYSVATVGTNTTFNSVSIYMKNIPLTTSAYTASSVYDPLASYTLVYSGSVTLSATGFKEIALTNPFVRTSGTNLQVLVIRNDGVTHAGFVYNCANGIGATTTINSTRRYNSTVIVSGSTVLAPSAFRQGIRLTHKNNNDAKVANIYTMGKLPIPYADSQVIKANITNVGVNPLTNIPVTLTVGGANSYSVTESIPSLAPGASVVVTFPYTIFTNIGNNTVTVSIPSDEDTTNNILTQSQEVNDNAWSYAVGTNPTGGVGFNGATGDFIAKFHTSINTLISQVSVNFTAGGQPFKIGIWDDDGTNGTPGTLLWESTSQTSTAGLYILPIAPSVPVSAGDFYVGVRQTGTVNVSFAYQTESPIRPQTFYFTSPSGNTTWTDFAPNNPFRFMIEPVLEQVCTATPSSAVASGPSSACAGLSFNLTASGFTFGTGIEYQWESSPAGQNNWTAIAGATNTVYTVAGLSGNTDFRMNTTCTTIGSVSSSNTVTVTENPFYDCYCASAATTVGNEEIYSVTLNGVNSNTFSNTASNAVCFTFAPGPGSILSRYSNFKNLGTLTNIMQGANVPFNIEENECDGAPYNAFGSAIYIDYNQNGSFADPGEQVFVEATTATGPRNVSGSFVVPSNAPTGITGMRIIVAEGFSGASLTPCLSYTYGETEDYLIEIVQGVQCAGTPNATTITGPTNACPNSNLSFVASGYSTDLGTSYRWESSPAGANTWSTVPGATSVALTVNGGVTTATDYRFVTTCSNSGLESYSNVINVTMNPFYSCYCSPVNGGGVGSLMNSVSFGSMTNNSATTNPISSPFYTAYSNTTTVTQGQVVPLSVTIENPGTYTGAIVSVWIDYNQDGVFSSTEWQQVGTNILGGTTATINVTIPFGANVGLTGMRIRSRGAGNTNGAGDACTTMGSGETEDYLITIAQAILCSGTPNATTITGPSGACNGVNFTLTAAGFSTDAGSEYQWESSPAGSGTWTPITGANGSAYTVVGGITSATDYRFITTCTFSGLNSISNTLSITINTPTQCYCIPTVTSLDELISSVTIDNFTNANTGFGVQGYQDFTSLPAIPMTTNTTIPFSATISPFYTNDVVAAWIDFNQDGLFTDSTERVYLNAPTTATTSGTITIPTSATLGLTRMRIRLDYNNTNPQACGNTSFGNIEDYMVNISSVSCPNPTVSISASNNNVCQGTSVTFTATAVDAGTTPTYQWYVNGNAVTGATNDQYLTSALANSDVVSVMVTSSCISAPNATSNTITMTVTPVTSNTTTASSCDSYTWSVNNMTYTASGTYSVTNGCNTEILNLTITPSTSNTTTANACDSYTWSVNNMTYTTSGTYSVTNGCNTEILNLTITPSTTNTTNITACNSYTWSVNNQTYTTSGSYSVTNGCTTEVLNLTINNVLPTANVTASGPLTLCSLGGSVTLTADQGSSYLWSNGATTQSITVNAAAAGTYSVVVTTAGGCTATSNPITVAVKTMPSTVKIKTVGLTSVCDPNTVLFTVDPNASSLYGFDFQWNLNGTPITGATDTTYTASGAGGGSVTLTVSGSTCTKTSAAKTYTIKPLPVATFTAGGPTTICAGQSVTLTAPTITGYTYTWLNNGVSAGSGASKVFKVAGVYSVVATLGGCKDTSNNTVSVVVNPLPVAGITALTPATFCAGDSCTMQATPAGATTYAWINGTTTVTTSTNTYATMVAGTFKMMVTDGNGCVSKVTTASVKTKVNPIPVASISASTSTTIAANGSVKLNASPSSGVTFQWFLNGSPISGATTKSYIATAGGDYTVAITKVTSGVGCTGMSAATTVTQTGIKEEAGLTSNPTATEEAVFELAAYPNPVSGVLTINVRGIEEVNATVQVMDFNGRVVAMKEMTTSSTTVDMTGYASGMYLIRYKDAEGRTGTVKINKQ